MPTILKVCIVFKKLFLNNLICVLFILIVTCSLCKGHFISTDDPCYLSYTCNHLHIPKCGKNGKTLETRLFLDECDMFEYNCDNKGEYKIVDLETCSHHDKTETVSTTILFSSLDTETTMLRTTSTMSTESITLPSSTTTETFATLSTFPNNELLTENSTNITKTKNTISITKPSITSVSSIKATTTTTAATIATESVNTTRITATYATESTASAISETTIEFTTTPESTFLSTTTEMEEFYQMEEPLPTITKESTSRVTTINSRNQIQTEIIPTPSLSTVEIVTEQENNTEIITSTYSTDSNFNKTDHTTKKLCNDIYPSYCNVPSKWDTTSVGETRDFFRILKEKYGRRSISSPYWPRRPIFL